jgi:voltage-gated potassium channel
VDKFLVSSENRGTWGIRIIASNKRYKTMLVNPESDTTMQAEDMLITLGEPAAIHKLDQVACGGVANA